MLNKRSTRTTLYSALTALLTFSLLMASPPAHAARVLIVGDLNYSFVADVADGIRSTLRTTIGEYPIANVKGRLSTIVEQERAQVVVALGNSAVTEAMHLPPEISVVYGLVVSPPRSRGNTTGVYMAPPASEYITTLRRYFPAIGKVAVVGSPAAVRSLAAGGSPQVTTYQVDNAIDLVHTVSRLTDSQALLLLPDANLLTGSAMESIFAFSFRNHIPLLGISEANVRQGSLFALVFEPKTVSRQIGEKVQSILNGNDADELPPSPPGRFNLFINSNTARKMEITIPAELLKKARKVYP